MVKALKVVMIIFGVILILTGLTNIFAPEQVAEMHGLAESTGYIKWLGALLGIVMVTAGFWIIAAGRDPLRDIRWVKFAITWTVLALVIHIYSMAQGYVDFSQAGVSVIIDAVFAVALLALYPWRGARVAE